MTANNRSPTGEQKDHEQTTGLLGPLSRFLGLFGISLERLDDPLLLFGATVVLLLGGVALFGSRLVSSDLRFLIMAILVVVLLVVAVYSIRGERTRTEATGTEAGASDPTASEPAPPQRQEPSSVKRPWVAVLDLENRSGEAEHEPMCFGVSNYLRTILETIPKDKYKIGVVPASQLRGFDRNTKLSEIREKTGARFVLEGSLDVRQDPRVIEVALKRTVDDGSILWQGEYLRHWSDIQQVTKEIAATVAAEVIQRTAGLDDEQRRAEIAQLSSEIREFPERSTAEFDAYNRGLYKQGTFNNLRQDADFREARAQLHRATKLSDQPFIEAMVQLGFLYILKWETNGDAKWLERSEETWEQILEQVRDHPFALTELAYVSYVRGSKDAVEAVKLARKAVDRHPDHTIANNVLALLYLYLGYYEANITIEELNVFKRAPFYVYPRTNAALAEQLRGFNEKALALAEQALEIEPKAFVAHLLAGAQYFYMGRYDDADRAWVQGQEHVPETVAGILEVPRAWIRAVEGDVAAARETLQAQAEAPWLAGPYGPYYISLAALAGEPDRAISLLEQERTFARSYRYLISEPTLEPLKEHPRFHKLLEQRYGEWKRNLDALEPGLTNPPDWRLPAPQDFLD